MQGVLNRRSHMNVLFRCNISDAFAGLGNIEDATGWAERGLKVGSAQSGQECDEGCGVILYNLGMLHEVICRISFFFSFKSRRLFYFHILTYSSSYVVIDEG